LQQLHQGGSPSRHLHAVAQPDIRSLEEQHNCIEYCFAANECGHPWKFEKADQEVEARLEGFLSVNDLDLALRAGIVGVGIVQLPEVLVAPFAAEGRLVPALADWSPQWSDFVLFYSSRRYVPLKLRVLIDSLRRETRQSRTNSVEVAQRAPLRLINGYRAAQTPRDAFQVPAGSLLTCGSCDPGLPAASHHPGSQRAAGPAPSRAGRIL